MTDRQWKTALGLLGATMLLASGAWWWVVYRQVVGSALISMPRAVHCLAGNSDLCTLAQELCTSSNHFLGIRRYETYLFWSGWGVIAMALLTSSPRSLLAREAHRVRPAADEAA